MSITYCHNCNKNIDTDFDATHIEDCVATDPLEHIDDIGKKVKERFNIFMLGKWLVVGSDAPLHLEPDKNMIYNFFEKEIQEAYKKGYIDGGLSK